jgi:hypothetical protein
MEILKYIANTLMVIAILMILSITLVPVMIAYRNAKNILKNIGGRENIRKISYDYMIIKDEEKVNKDYMNVFYGKKYYGNQVRLTDTEIMFMKWRLRK